MADLNSIQATEATRLVGSDATGNELTPVQSTPNGDLKVQDSIRTGGTQGAISVSTTPVAVRVGGSNLVNRKLVTAHNNGTASLLYWGYTNTVSSATGTPIYRNQVYAWSADATCDIYIVAASGTHDVRVTESP